MNKIVCGLIILTLVVGAAVGGYKLGGQHEAQYNAGKTSNLEQELVNSRQDNSSTGSRNAELLSNYNKLVGDYNSLRDEVIKYVNSNQYQPKQSLSCTSNSIGASVYTNCY